MRDRQSVYDHDLPELALTFEIIDILAAAERELVEPEWEWSVIGDNNLLAWNTARQIADLAGTTREAVYPAVCAELRRRWRARGETYPCSS